MLLSKFICAVNRLSKSESTAQGYRVQQGPELLHGWLLGGHGARSPAGDHTFIHAVRWGGAVLTVSGCWKLLMAAHCSALTGQMDA